VRWKPKRIGSGWKSSSELKRGVLSFEMAAVAGATAILLCEVPQEDIQADGGHGIAGNQAARFSGSASLLNHY
jgi:hypothetical protein